jgi:hypothetical protein
MKGKQWLKSNDGMAIGTRRSLTLTLTLSAASTPAT